MDEAARKQIAAQVLNDHGQFHFSIDKNSSVPRLEISEPDEAVCRAFDIILGYKTHDILSAHLDDKETDGDKIESLYTDMQQKGVSLVPGHLIVHGMENIAPLVEAGVKFSDLIEDKTIRNSDGITLTNPMTPDTIRRYHLEHLNGPATEKSFVLGDETTPDTLRMVYVDNDLRYLLGEETIAPWRQKDLSYKVTGEGLTTLADAGMKFPGCEHYRTPGLQPEQKVTGPKFRDQLEVDLAEARGMA